MVTSKTNKEVVIKTAERKIARIARGEIEEMQRSKKSLMPDFLLSDLTPQEAADLLEYLRAPNNLP